MELLGFSVSGFRVLGLFNSECVCLLDAAGPDVEVGDDKEQMKVIDHTVHL